MLTVLQCMAVAAVGGTTLLLVDASRIAFWSIVVVFVTSALGILAHLLPWFATVLSVVAPWLHALLLDAGAIG